MEYRNKKANFFAGRGGMRGGEEETCLHKPQPCLPLSLLSDFSKDNKYTCRLY